MIYITNRLRIIFRVALLALFICGAVYCFLQTSFVIVPLLLSLLAVLSCISLILYVERTNREFTDFLLAIRNSDFTKGSDTDKRGKSFALLKKAKNTILEEYQRVRIEKEAHYFLLQTVIEQVKTAVICFDGHATIVLMNDPAKKMLDTPYINNIESLRSSHGSLYERMTGSLSGHLPVLEMEKNGERYKLSLRLTDFLLDGKEHRLVSISNIENEIDQTELQTWERLIHVLTHEIMNSITPVSTLSSLLKEKAEMLAAENRSNEKLKDIAGGLQVIEKRSMGLVSFVERYKTLTVLPAPDFQLVEAKHLFERIRLLTAKELAEKNIRLKCTISSASVWLYADPDLTEQLLLNLVNNAVYAMQQSPDPVVELNAMHSGENSVITVSDNGSGIHSDHINHIFIPFFTTKKTGSGIGLSFSKQVMKLHQGTIFVSSQLNKGTEFRLLFPAAPERKAGKG